MRDFDLRLFRQFAGKVLRELPTILAMEGSRDRREAGAKLGIDGSAVTKCIRRLEQTLEPELNGGSLIDYGEPRALERTEAGNLLLAFAHDIRDASARFLGELETLQRGSQIRLAMTRSAWLSYGNELEAAYRKVRTDGVLNFGNEFYSRDRVWENIELNVLESRADVGVYSFPPSRIKKQQIRKGLAVQKWMEEEVVLVFPGDYPRLPRGHTVSLSALAVTEPIVHYRRSLEFDRTTTIEAYLKRQKLLKRYKGDWLLGVDTISEIKDTLVRKGGISFLPWPDVAHEHGRRTLRAYRLAVPMRPRLIWLAYRLHTSRPAIVDFIKAVGKLGGKREFRA